MQVLDKNGKSDINKVVSGLNWATKNNMDVINISFGFPFSDNRLEKSINRALKKGVIIIASAGNKYGMEPGYPAKYKGVLSIGAINQQLKISDFSSEGKVDFVALGENIKAVQIGKLQHIETLEGTSFATAYVTGKVINLLSDILISKNSLMTDLQKYSLDLGNIGIDEVYGNGLLTLKVEE